MTNENLDEMILYVLKKYKILGTHVVKNWIAVEFKKSTTTKNVRNRLKKLQKQGVVVNVPSGNNRLFWKIA